MELDDTFFGIAPESLNTIDVDLPITKMLAVDNIDMSVPTKHERIIAFELVRLNNAPASDHFNRQVEKRLNFDILSSLDMDTTVSLEDAKYRNLINCAASAFSFTLPPKVRFVQFNRPVHPVRESDTMSNRLPDGLESRRIAQPNLIGEPAGRYLQFKEFDDSQPLFRADFDTVYPPVTEVMKGVVALLATVSFAYQPVDFIAVASAAKNMPFFPAEFVDIHSGTVFTFDDEIKGFKFHLHYYNLMQELL